MDSRYISFGARTKQTAPRSKLDPADTAPRMSLGGAPARSRSERAAARGRAEVKAIKKVVAATKSAAKSMKKAGSAKPRSKGVNKKAGAGQSKKRSAAPKNLGQKRTTARKSAPRKSKSPRRSSSNALLCRPSYNWGPGNTHSNVSESRRRRCMRLRNSEGDSLDDTARCRENPKRDDSCVVRGKRQYSDNSRSQKAARDFRALKRSGAIKGPKSNVKKSKKRSKARQ